jgi:hypothetical protein
MSVFLAHERADEDWAAIVANTVRDDGAARRYRDLIVARFPWDAPNLALWRNSERRYTTIRWLGV